MNKDKLFELDNKIRTTYRLFRKEMNELMGETLNSNEFIVLKFLLSNGEARASDIAQNLNVSASHITTVTESLVQKSYITRKRLVNDRRVVQFTLTTEGTNLVKSLSEKKELFLREKFSVFTDDEATTFIYLLSKLD